MSLYFYKIGSKIVDNIIFLYYNNIIGKKNKKRLLIMVKMKLGELIDLNEQCGDSIDFISMLEKIVEKNPTKSVEFFDNMNITDIRHKLVDLKDVVTHMIIIAVDLID